MRAVVLGPRGLQFSADHPTPVPDQGQAVIRVLLAGICSTDLELVKGYMEFQGVVGHEFVGVVEQAAESDWVGRRVVSSINFADANNWEYAEFGLEHHPRRSVLGILNRDGAMADRVLVPLANLFEVPAEVSDRQAVFAEPLAAALRIAEQVRVSPSSRVAVLGPGRLGMLIAKALSLYGCDLILLGRNESSLKLAAEWGLQTGLTQPSPNREFDIVVEATGTDRGLATALGMVKPRGTLVMKSTYLGLPQVDLTPIVIHELMVIGSRCGPFAPALRLLQSGVFQVGALIDAEYPIECCLEAFEHASRPGVRKVLLTME